MGHPRRWLILAILCGALSAIVIDNSILSVAVPTLARSLHADRADLQWITTAYSIVLAGLLLPLAVLGDRRGRKGLLLVGLVVFGGASIAAALAATPTQLTIARGVMGIGGACAMPATLAVIGNVFAPHERSRAIAVWAGVAGIASVAGPIIGGLLLDHFWWGAIFLVNVPIVAATVIATIIVVPTSRDPAAPPADVRGSLLWMAALSTLVFGFIEGPVQGWVSVAVIASFAFALLSLATFARHERRAAAPLLAPRTARDPRLRAGVWSITATFFAVFGVQFVLTLWLQATRGLSPLEAGLCFAPMGIASLLGTMGNVPLARRVGHFTAAVIGLGAMAAGVLLAGAAVAAVSVTVVVVALALIGAGLGVGSPSGIELTMSSAPAEQAGSAAGINETVVEAGGALGVAVLGSVLTATTSSSWPMTVGAAVLAAGALAIRRAHRRAPVDSVEAVSAEGA